MKNRTSHKTEVDSLESLDGNTVFSTRKRVDGNYQFYVETLIFDEEEEVYYWSQNILPRPSLFGSINGTKAEIFSQFGNSLKSS